MSQASPSVLLGQYFGSPPTTAFWHQWSHTPAAPNLLSQGFILLICLDIPRYPRTHQFPKLFSLKTLFILHETHHLSDFLEKRPSASRFLQGQRTHKHPAANINSPKLPQSCWSSFCPHHQTQTQHPSNSPNSLSFFPRFFFSHPLVAARRRPIAETATASPSAHARLISRYFHIKQHREEQKWCFRRSEPHPSRSQNGTLARRGMGAEHAPPGQTSSAFSH